MERHCKLADGIPVAVVDQEGPDTLPIEVVGFDHDPVTQIRIGPRQNKLGRIYSGGRQYYDVQEDKVIERHTVLDRVTVYQLEDGTPTTYNARVHDIVDEADEHTDTEYIRTITVRVNEDKLAQAPLLIDRETGEEIARRVHPESGTHLEVGILRDQIVHILNALGLEPTAEFQRHADIAVEEIAAGRAKKEGLYGN